MNELPADVGALVEHWRRATPDREAIRFGQQSWTWAQFAGRVERNAAAQGGRGPSASGPGGGLGLQQPATSRNHAVLPARGPSSCR